LLTPACTLILTPDGSGMSCIIPTVMSWPDLDLAEEIVELKRTGSIVPLGMAIAPSLADPPPEECKRTTNLKLA